MKQLIFSLIFAFSSQALALYDFAAINITPQGEQISFCFKYDSRKIVWSELYFADNFYMAAVTQQAEILFIKPTPEGGLTITQWGHDVPIFSQWGSEPICLGPFPKSALQGLQLYAGIGNSLDDLIQRNSLIKFFDGFPALPKPEKAWTVMVYMVGSDLEAKPGRKAGKRWASKDILEMLEGSANESTNIVITTGGSTRNGWSTVKRAFIENGQQYVLEDLGAKNMASPQTLSDFVTWSKTQFPAQHYALILWNHGGGTQGYGFDTSPAGNREMMNLNQLHQAYQTIRAQLKKPLDIVVYDACLMASIEVAEITATVANVMAGSAELEPGHGIDYAHLLSNIGISRPDNGLAFGSVVKTGYIEHTKVQGTFDRSQITYSVFDLTQLNSFTETFKLFAIEFKNILEKPSFLNTERLARGIIHAPGYPFRQAGRLRSLNNDHIRIDLYSVLQTVGPDFPEFKAYADQLLAIIDLMVVDYDGNIADIDPNAGRVSLNIGSDKSYLAALPEAYTLLSEGFAFYNQKRQEAPFTFEGEFEFVCPEGIICGDAQWLELLADDVLGIEAYFGQSSGEIFNIYRIDKSFYQYRELTEDLELGVDGHKACQYQICVNNEAHCEDITLTEQGNQLLADILLNDSPAVLSFCNTADEMWSACGVVSQIEGIWGRDETLYPDDRIIPYTLHLKNDELEQQQGNSLVVDESALATLKKSCDLSNGIILVAFYSLNGERQFKELCDRGDCICQEGSEDDSDSCQNTGFNAGVILTPF